MNPTITVVSTGVLLLVLVSTAALGGGGGGGGGWHPPTEPARVAGVGAGSVIGTADASVLPAHARAPTDRSTRPSAAAARAGQASTDIVVRPRSLRFPREPSGPVTRNLSVRNVGDAPLTVRSVVIVGPDRAAFDQSLAGSVTIAPNDSAVITVSFEVATPGPRFATMQLMSDDPDAPQTNVWLTNTPTVAAVSPSRVLQNKTLVNATITDVEANTTQSLNISWPLTRDDVVAVDALEFTPLRDGNVTLSVATNTSRFGQVPTFALADGTEPASYIHIDHDIANANVTDVGLVLRVRTDRLAGAETGPEDVALYRYRNGTWVELPTELVNEGATHYIFEARSPGLSDFATGVKQAKFRITDAIVTVTEIRTGEGTAVQVRVTNVGGADGTYDVKLILDGDVVDRRALSIAPNGTRQATFERSFAEPGTYELFVNERFVATVTVGRGTGTSVSGPNTGTRPTDGAVPGFGIHAVVLALGLAVLVGLGRARR